MLPDYLAEDLVAVFVGTSVATASASRRHYYAGPGNKFWQLIADAGITHGQRLTPEQDDTVLGYGIGLTDLVKGRAASSDALLTKSDYDVPGFLRKVEAFRPYSIAFNGKEAARRVARHLNYAAPTLGLLPWRIGPTHLFVLPSSSGASSNPKHFAPKLSKPDWWNDFGGWLRSSRHDQSEISLGGAHGT